MPIGNNRPTAIQVRAAEHLRRTQNTSYCYFAILLRTYTDRACYYFPCTQNEKWYIDLNNEIYLRIHSAEWIRHG